ncbi:hypothetical protein [Pedobacter nanyangensis]|uniref:hypothetical protein n=1 Tax=Pedobacter nanyangensis TaxID=1562389 RepID=UPI000DE50E8F|nr:hypothetical protein [Pedobacter nanyangensis]
MSERINFEIHPTGIISKKFLLHNIHTFSEAANFVRKLRYSRNKNKADLSTVFDDKCGTCSTKHALLKRLSEENNIVGFKLMIGIFKMNAANTPKIAATLAKNQLPYLPEAHTYLKWKNEILDYTNEHSKPSDFANDLLEEIEIRTNQISNFKVSFHQNFLANWLKTQQNLMVSMEELWQIREQCIIALSSN